ncbi:MAG: type VI secretion system-associated FHA domain protein TagH [Azoarcus sp.]|jgi:FHA domain-containing protein|nr:type VI secretion system-associated FHA domain protein TagH [Azoarcus sp.]
MTMIHIRSLKHLTANAEACAAQFGPEGGTIGRAPTNTLVLDDPERTVSRVHAQIVCRDGRWFVIDRGSNPMLCNSHALGTGNEAPLAHGDRLVIGSFELSVEVLDATPSADAQPAAVAAPDEDDPFAELLAGLVPPAAVAPAGTAASAAASPPDTLPDPFAAGASASDPFADLLAPAPVAAASSASPPASGGGGLLDDFADLSLPAAQGASSIDHLFGSGGGLGGDPLALSPLADPLHAPNTARDADPLAALAGTAAPTPAPRGDHLPIGQFGFAPPQALTPAPKPKPAPVPPVSIVATPVPPPSTPPPAAAVSAPAPRIGDDALLAAFLRGLQRLDPTPQQLTPALLERAGALLRIATEGTLHLLLARQELKQGLRAERTMIAANDNNPLKFSPTVEVALAHLLGPGVRGFMPAEAAMRDAFDDLRAHQFGVMVGLRAALEQLIARFAPNELEKKIAAKSTLDSLFAAGRKAKLWDEFINLYTEIAREAQDDFDTLFGQAFLQAYEAQMARLKQHAPGS